MSRSEEVVTCDSCGKSSLERWVTFTISNSHYGMDGVWPSAQSREDHEYCSRECIRKEMAATARKPFNDEELRKIAEQERPDLAGELIKLKAENECMKKELEKLRIPWENDPNRSITAQELKTLLTMVLEELRLSARR